MAEKHLTGAIIGCGRVTQDHYIPVWQRLGREAVHRWVLADVSFESRFAAQMQLGVPNEHSYRDYRAMLLREKPDFVLIATPHISHVTIAVDCLNAGVPALVDKPMAVTLAGARRIVDTAEVEGVPLAVIHNYAARPQSATVWNLLQSDAIGRPFLYRAETLGVGWMHGVETFDEDWRARMDIAGGGCLLDNGYHAVYLARKYLGPIVSVRARVESFRRDIEVDDTALLLIGHENGAISSVQVAWSLAGEGQVVNEMYGPGGTLRIEPDGTVAIHRAGQEWERHRAPADPGFEIVFRNFLNVINGTEAPLTTGDDALETLRVVRAAYASAARGMVVNVPAFTDDETDAGAGWGTADG